MKLINGLSSSISGVSSKIKSWNIKDGIKFLAGYLLFVFILTVVVNVQADDEGNHSEYIITLSSFVINLIGVTAVLL